MIDLAEFLFAQQVSWIKRASSSSRDTWRVDLKKIGKGEILTVSPNEVQPEIYPLFKHLTVSYETFLKAFNRINENFYKAKLINNPLLKRGRNDNRKINWSFFSNNNPRLEAQTLNNVKIVDQQQLVNSLIGLKRALNKLGNALARRELVKSKWMN